MSDGELVSSAPVEALLQEILVLSNQIKKSAFQVDGNEWLPAPTKVLLQDLRRFGARTVPHLARERASSRQNVQIIVNRLEKLGYVVSASNPNHKKSELITLTSLGEQVLEKSEREALQMIDRLGGAITDRQSEDVLRVLKKLRIALGGSEPLPSLRRTHQRVQPSTRPDEAEPISQEVPESDFLEEATPEVEDTSLPYNLL